MCFIQVEGRKFDIYKFNCGYKQLKRGHTTKQSIVMVCILIKIRIFRKINEQHTFSCCQVLTGLRRFLRVMFSDFRYPRNNYHTCILQFLGSFQMGCRGNSNFSDGSRKAASVYVLDRKSCDVGEVEEPLGGRIFFPAGVGEDL